MRIDINEELVKELKELVGMNSKDAIEFALKQCIISTKRQNQLDEMNNRKMRPGENAFLHPVRSYQGRD